MQANEYFRNKEIILSKNSKTAKKLNFNQKAYEYETERVEVMQPRLYTE